MRARQGVKRRGKQRQLRRVLLWAALLVGAAVIVAARSTKPGPAPVLPIPTSAVLLLNTPTSVPSATPSVTHVATLPPTFSATPNPPTAAPAPNSPTLVPSPAPPTELIVVTATAASTVQATAISTVSAPGAGNPQQPVPTQGNGPAGGGGTTGVSPRKSPATVAPTRRPTAPQRATAVLPPTATQALAAPTATRDRRLEAARVVRVIDGDTIVVQVEGGGEAHLRLIGMDAPETNKGPLCYGKEASDKAEELLAASENRVLLEKDVSETDRYARLLRYVWLPGDGEHLMLNEELVKQGYARAAAYPPDVKYQGRFEAAEQDARGLNLGLWGACSSFGAPLFTPIIAVEPTVAAGNLEPSPPLRYDPNGPDRNCSDFATHDEAQRFFIAAGGPQRDPHRLDADHDGLACEKLP